MDDKAGNPLMPGDIIVYGHNLGRCAGLRYGKVIKITTKPDPHAYKDPSKTITKVTVHGVDDDWTHRGPELLSKKSTLEFSKRMLKVDRHQVPKELLDLLDTVKIE